MAASKTVDDLKDKLIRKITMASSHDQIDRYISTVVSELHRQKVNPHIIARFIDKLLRALQAAKDTITDAETTVKIKYALSEITIIRETLHKKDAVDHM